jgi:tRNA (guanine37-N1)-methyltransferase
VRLLPGVLGNDESAKADSFGCAYQGDLEHPLYTRPPIYRGLEVPPVLLQGDHKAIADWQREQRQKLRLPKK